MPRPAPGGRNAHRTTIQALALAAIAVLAAHADDSPPTPTASPRWLVGDLHVHVAPPDGAGHSALTTESAIAAARKAGLDFIALTPHGADRSFPDPSDEKAPAISGQALAARLAASALLAAPAVGTPQARPLVVVSGWEFTRDTPGHLGLTFFRVEDLEKAADADKARIALGRGALVVVNHPFFRPVASDLPVMKMVTGDRRWRPFFGEGRDDLAWNAIEVWHERSVLVQKLHTGLGDKFPGTQMAADSLRAWDEATRTQRRRIVGVGGSDSHGRVPYAIAPMAVMAVRVESADEDGLRRGLLAGHVTFGRGGGVSAADLTATSDVEGARACVGDSLAAKSQVRLAWSGRATLWEDGANAGEFEGGAVRKLDPPGSFHSWRIEKPGDAFSNPVYANLE